MFNYSGKTNNHPLRSRDSLKFGEHTLKTREQIITDMCYTWRHDYGLSRNEHDGPGGLITAGLTDEQRQMLWRQMAQIFDNNIAPHMIFKNVDS